MSVASAALAPANITLCIGKVSCSAPVRRPVGGTRHLVSKATIRLTRTPHTAAELAPLPGESMGVQRNPAAGGDRIHVYRTDGSFVCALKGSARAGAGRRSAALPGGEP